jgi:hypothetical protein
MNQVFLYYGLIYNYRTGLVTVSRQLLAGIGPWGNGINFLNFHNNRAPWT